MDHPAAPVTTLVVEASVAWWRRRSTLVVALLLVVSAVAFAIYRQFRRRAERAELTSELRRASLTAIAAQMNPHFIFNALNSIQEFVLDQDPVKANLYLGRFARLMRLTLEHSSAEQIPLGDEIEAMRLYVDLERLRRDEVIRVDFSVAPNVPLHATLPPLLVQPYIENAFKHGLAGSRGGLIEVDYRLTAAGELVVTVSDDGIGRVAAERRNVRRRRAAFGAGATARRIELLSQSAPGHVRVEVRDRYAVDGSSAGTLVRLYVKLGLVARPAPARPTHQV